MDWKTVEKAIIDEMQWLKQTILPFRASDNPFGYSDEIFYRLIAMLIVAGKIRVRCFSYEQMGIFVPARVYDKKHGAEWHDDLINSISRHFKERGWETECNQPKLYYGCADLRVSLDQVNVYFEIGTVSIFKLWINFIKMKRAQIVNVTANKVTVFNL